MRNYYEILGINTDATTDEINRAYKKLAQKYHPDMNNNDPAYADLFKDINEAKEVLTDEDKREEFD